MNNLLSLQLLTVEEQSQTVFGMAFASTVSNHCTGVVDPVQ